MSDTFRYHSSSQRKEIVYKRIHRGVLGITLLLCLIFVPFLFNFCFGIMLRLAPPLHTHCFI